MNLVVRGERVRWRELIEDAKQRTGGDHTLVELQDARAHTREGLLAAILAELGMGTVKLPKKTSRPGGVHRPNTGPGVQGAGRRTAI